MFILMVSWTSVMHLSHKSIPSCCWAFKVFGEQLLRIILLRAPLFNLPFKNGVRAMEMELLCSGLARLPFRSAYLVDSAQEGFLLSEPLQLPLWMQRLMVINTSLGVTHAWVHILTLFYSCMTWGSLGTSLEFIYILPGSGRRKVLLLAIHLIFLRQGLSLA